MILRGAELIARFQPVLLGFAGLLLFSSWKLLTRGSESEDEDLSDNNIVRLCRCSPTCLANMHDLFILEYNEFLLGLQQANLNMRSIQQQKSCRHMVQISDVVFAVDSIPAVCLLVFPWMLTLRISENFGGYSMITA